MKQSKNKIDCTPSKDEEGVARCLIQMCKAPMLLLPLV